MEGRKRDLGYGNSGDCDIQVLARCGLLRTNTTRLSLLEVLKSRHAKIVNGSPEVVHGFPSKSRFETLLATQRKERRHGSSVQLLR